MGWTKKIKHRFFVKGGVHPRAQKQASSMKIFPGPASQNVVIPLEQHVGVACEPLVEVGERVLLGQKIGDSNGYVSAPVHSSVSGEVTGILKYPHPRGRGSRAIKILSDKLDTPVSGLVTKEDPLALTPEEVRACVREAGIVGLGGAAFPTHVKLAPPADKPVEYVILNGAECEPYLCGDFRLMVERPSDIIRGGLVIKKTVGAKKLIVGVEHDRVEAIEALREAGRPWDIEVLPLPCRYPTGAEKVLVKNITGREVPCGGLPVDVGAIVSNVGTAAQIFDSLTTGMPVVDRVMTVAGDGIAGKANLRVKIGTSVRDVIEHCGGFTGERGKVIIGGPMMGIAQYTMDVPVIKSSTGIVVLRGETLFCDEPPHFICIRCGRCVRRCPMNLMSYQIGACSDAGMWEQLERLNIEDCVECGSCAYTCPTKNSLVQLVKVGKEGLARRKKRMETLEAGNGAPAGEDEDEDDEENIEEEKDNA
ncbi:MAG: electron transport complex subunit RsxC [Candidatus Anoxymicrobium japonicum]|uniref:Ion-translocating oxidoreductase complex subunit C n=1 Tax=Candidatus Anoxymicrobium japonicum TaxID=2013648 RepID=A0A2N3G7D5_9ACTN|nr:MAG: electron transport complex subunit RsxC [Candidatus Anoxymicrobium japonicum]